MGRRAESLPVPPEFANELGNLRLVPGDMVLTCHADWEQQRKQAPTSLPNAPITTAFHLLLGFAGYIKGLPRFLQLRAQKGLQAHFSAEKTKIGNEGFGQGGNEGMVAVLRCS